MSTRSNGARTTAAAMTRAVARTSAPRNASSVITTARWAPMERARRIADTVPSGPIDTTVTSPSEASASCRAASTAYSSPGSSVPSPSRFTRKSSPSSASPFGSGMDFTSTTMFMRVRGYRPGISAARAVASVHAFRAGRDVGRGRFVGRSVSAQRAGIRRRGLAHEPRAPGRRGARVLRAGCPGGRRRGGADRRDPVRDRGPVGRVRCDGDRGLRGRARGRPDAEPVRALQR